MKGWQENLEKKERQKKKEREDARNVIGGVGRKAIEW